jgi:hypothetical protein
VIVIFFIYNKVNNAGASGVVVDEDGLRALNIDPASWVSNAIYALWITFISAQVHV